MMHDWVSAMLHEQGCAIVLKSEIVCTFVQALLVAPVLRLALNHVTACRGPAFSTNNATRRPEL